MLKRGRPPKNNKRDDSYRIRLNAEERQMLTEISEWRGLTMADVIRIALFAYYDLAKSNKNTSIKVPKINWIPFDKNNLPRDLMYDDYLILLREDNYDDGETWRYSVDKAKPYGDYLDDFWDTDNDWHEGQKIEVVAYAEFPYFLEESELVEW